MIQKNKKELDKIKEGIDKIEKPYPITVSDWVNYLNEVITRWEMDFAKTYSLVFTLVVIIIAMFSLMFSILFFKAFFASYGIFVDIEFIYYATGITAGGLIFIYCFMVGHSILKRYSKKSEYPKAVKLFKEIMKGNITNPKIIRDRWFEEKNNE